MKVYVADIKEKPRQATFEELYSAFPTLVAMVDEGECSFAAPIRAELVIAREYDHLRTEGRVATSAKLTCSRCLAEYETTIDAPFTVFFTKTSSTPLDEEVELAEKDLISADYNGDEIDFAPLIEEQVVMALPLKPLCKEECLGLCSACGTDLNVSPCGCVGGVVSLKFSALQKLKIEK